MNLDSLTATQKCKYLVLVTLSRIRKSELPPFESGEQIDAVYATEQANDDGNFQDARNESRYGIEAPEITDAPFSRNYEIEAHVGELPNGSWVGWWFASGGGKFGDPDNAIDWVASAFDINHTAQVIQTTKHTFVKI